MEQCVWKTLTLHGRNGQRKYLNLRERDAFLSASVSLPFQRRVFCYLLACTGCRISEALSLRACDIDVEERVLVIETLKQRRRGIYRGIPVPEELIELLLGLETSGRLFEFSRTTAWRFVKKVMVDAGIGGEHNCMPKAFRHSFGIVHAQAKTPPHLMQRWFGHAKIETTHIYLDAVGDEERELASAVWPSFSGFEKKNFNDGA